MLLSSEEANGVVEENITLHFIGEGRLETNSSPDVGRTEFDFIIFGAGRLELNSLDGSARIHERLVPEV